MKKSLLITSLLFVLLFVSCGHDPSLEENTTPSHERQVNALSMDYMESLTVALGDAKMIGIEAFSEDDEQARPIEIRRNYKLITSISGDLLSIVYFNVADKLDAQTVDINGKAYEPGDRVDQEDIPGVIDKLYVTPEYILISFIVERPENIDASALVETGTKQYRSVDFWLAKGGYNDPNSVNGSVSTPRICAFPTMTVKYSLQDGSQKEETLTYRPEELTYTNNTGVAEYDMFDYYSSDLRKSFVISRKDNKIYKIEGVTIDIDEYTGIPRTKDNGIVKFTVNSEGELEVHQVIFEEAIGQPIYVYQDKYGHIFVFNSSGVDEINEELGVFYYYYNWQYLLATDKTALSFKYYNKDGSEMKNSKGEGAPFTGGRGYGQSGYCDAEAYVILEDDSTGKYQTRQLEASDRFVFDYNQWSEARGSHVGEIRDGKLITLCESHDMWFSIVDFIQKEGVCNYIATTGPSNLNGILLIHKWPYVLLDESSNTDELFDIFCLNVISAYEAGFFYTDYFVTQDVPYDYTEWESKWKTNNLCSQNFEFLDLILENVQWDEKNEVFSKTTSTSKQDFFFDNDPDTGRIKAYVVGTFVAPEEPVAIFQPL